MTGAEPFALLVVLMAGVVLVAVLSNRLTHRVKLPSPALFLVGAAIAAKIIPALHGPPQQAVERVVTVALACILFDGGMNIGRARFRSAAAPIAVVGVLGTFLTVIAGALLVHFAFGLAWYVSLLVATAVATSRAVPRRRRSHDLLATRPTWRFLFLRDIEHLHGCTYAPQFPWQAAPIVGDGDKCLTRRNPWLACNSAHWQSCRHRAGTRGRRACAQRGVCRHGGV
jgi:hypothetical protein